LFIYFLSCHHYSGREKNIAGERAHLSGVVALFHILYLQIKQAIWRADLLLLTKRLFVFCGVFFSPSFFIIIITKTFVGWFSFCVSD